ncbi:MAG: copper amine oxidase N-terminal domain-containing protein [Lawsonibacter sp.]
MKKNMMRFIGLALSLALTLSLTLPALAYEDTNPPLWEQWGYSSREEMLNDGWSEEEYSEMVESQQAWEAEQEAWETRCQVWINAHPAEVADFDPYAYFESEYSYYDSPEEYMEWNELTEPEFRQTMLESWVSDMLYLEDQREAMAQEKLAVGGYTDGINVMVNGTCIPFSSVRPEIQNDRTMVPIADVFAYLGATVSYDQINHAVTVSFGDFSISHAIGSRVLTYGDGEQIAIDAASYVKDGRAMVPLAFFAQALGYEIYWDSEYETVVLLNRQEAVDQIDRQFTLVNRVLYDLAGGDQRKTNQSLNSTLDMDLAVTLLDSLNGDKTYSAKLSGSALTNDTAGHLQYTANLGQLLDLYLAFASSDGLSQEDQAEIARYRSLLSPLTVELILDLDGQCLYVRSPLLTELGLVENAEAWAALPLNGLLDASVLSFSCPTVGQLLISAGFANAYSPFLAWSDITNVTQQAAAYVGDDCFTKSGSSYMVNWDIADLLSSGSDETFTALLTVSPSGSDGCTYTLSASAEDSEATFDIKLSGSSGKTDLNAALHLKNVLKAVLELEARITTSFQQPLTQPPAGDAIEYPAGILGVGQLDG